jgi:hypothetical protein
MRPSTINAKLKRYCASTTWLARLNLNIPFNMRKYFRLTNFWAILYIAFSIWTIVNNELERIRKEAVVTLI